MTDKKLKQMDLAEKLGIRQSQVSNWLNGKSEPGYKSLKRICEVFELDANYLLGLVTN